jgi:hypothetical protein
LAWLCPQQGRGVGHPGFIFLKAIGPVGVAGRAGLPMIGRIMVRASRRVIAVRKIQLLFYYRYMTISEEVRFNFPMHGWNQCLE